MAPVATNISSGRNGSKTVRITERERVATLSGSAAFTVQQTLQINPSLPAFLPWLSTMAQLYEKYRVKSIRVMYHNLCGTNTAGNVLMSYDPDVLDSAPADAVSFSQSTRYIDGAPWRMLTLNIPGSNQTLFTRSGTAPTGSDLKTYDYGQIHIATEAMADDATVGYIEIAYDFEFLERQPAPASGGGSYIFRPQVYAGVPDPDSPILLTYTGADYYGKQMQQTNVKYNGVLPLQALVDDIGITTFNGSLVLPAGAYAVSSAKPNGGYAIKRSMPQEGTECVSTDMLSYLLATLGIELLDPLPSGQDDPVASLKSEPTFSWLDSTGCPVDAVGIADLTGISLYTSFEIKLTNKRRADGNPGYVGCWQANGQALAGEGSFTATLSPAPQGSGVWPTAVITRLS
jgi:hypothetical protein